MKGLRLMSNGRWNKPPVLMAARHIIMHALQQRGPCGPLGSLAEFVNGTSYDPGELSDEGTPIIRISNISDPTSPYLRTAEAFEPRFIARKGELLVSWSASFKSIVWPGPDGVVNQHIFKVTPVGTNCRSFIRHAIEAAFDDMQEKTVGIGMMHLRRSDFLGHEVAAPDHHTQTVVAAYLDWVEAGSRGAEPPLPPPLAEQRRIVARLDALAAKIEHARGLSARSEESLASALATAASSIFSQETHHCQRRRFGEFSAHVTSGPRSWSSRCRTDAEMRFYRAQDIGADGRLVEADAVYVDPPQSNQGATARTQPGDLLIVITGATVGRVGLFEDGHEPGYVSQHVAICRLPSSEINPEYAHWWLRSREGGSQLLSQRYGQGKPGLNLSNIRALTVPVPPLSTQAVVVARLATLEARLVEAMRLRREASERTNAVLPALPDRAFAGAL